jgi:hypothetical protein
MTRHPVKFVKSILVLLLSIAGLAIPLSAGYAQDRPVVLLIARGDNPPLGEASLKVAIDKEVNTIISKLNGLGYAVDVASENGKDITAAGSTLKVDKKLADVQATHYSGVVIPYMSHVNVPAEAVKIVQDMQSRNLPVAAQNGGVLVLDVAGALKGRNYAQRSGWSLERYWSRPGWRHRDLRGLPLLFAGVRPKRRDG